MAWRPEHENTIPANTAGGANHDANRDDGWNTGWGADTPTPPHASNSRRSRSSRTLADMPTVQTPYAPHAPRPSAPSQRQQFDPRWDGPQYAPDYPESLYPEPDAPTQPAPSLARPVASSRTLAGMASRSGVSLPGPLPGRQHRPRGCPGRDARRPHRVRRAALRCPR